MTIRLTENLTLTAIPGDSRNSYAAELGRRRRSESGQNRQTCCEADMRCDATRLVVRSSIWMVICQPSNFRGKYSSTFINRWNSRRQHCRS